VLVIYAICVVLAVLSLTLSGRGQISAFVIIVVVGGVALYLLTRRAQGALDRSSYPEESEPGTLAELRDAVMEPAEERSEDRPDEPPESPHQRTSVGVAGERGKT